MKLKNQTIHVWTGSLAITDTQADQFQQVLSPDEQDRARRFQFPIHRIRYVAAHYQLRKILGKYTGCEPSAIQFSYSKHSKPSLHHPDNTAIQFNLSHSENMNLIALGLDFPLGVDVERVQESCNIDIAERFFSKDEIAQLAKLDENEKRIAFYRIWSRKEALIKATGKGLSQSLPSFSVTARDLTESIKLDNEVWQLRPISVDTDFQAALACHPSVQDVDIFSFDEMLSK